MAISKLILNGVTQMDVTQDTVTAETLAQGETAHDASGVQITGTASGGGVGVSGSFTLSSNVTSDYLITNTATIGFVPSIFILRRDHDTTTANHICSESYIKIGTSQSSRCRVIYTSSGLVSATNLLSWTQSINGYMDYYQPTGAIYMAARSDTILGADSYTWIAIP